LPGAYADSLIEALKPHLVIQLSEGTTWQDAIDFQTNDHRNLSLVLAEFILKDDSLLI
jgi:hypothetical protein